MKRRITTVWTWRYELKYKGDGKSSSFWYLMIFFCNISEFFLTSEIVCNKTINFPQYDFKLAKWILSLFQLWFREAIQNAAHAWDWSTLPAQGKLSSPFTESRTNKFDNLDRQPCTGLTGCPTLGRIRKRLVHLRII